MTPYPGRHPDPMAEMVSNLDVPGVIYDVDSRMLVDWIPQMASGSHGLDDGTHLLGALVDGFSTLGSSGVHLDAY